MCCNLFSKISLRGVFDKIFKDHWCRLFEFEKDFQACLGMHIDLEKRGRSSSAPLIVLEAGHAQLKSLKGDENLTNKTTDIGQLSWILESCETITNRGFVFYIHSKSVTMIIIEIIFIIFVCFGVQCHYGALVICLIFAILCKPKMSMK